MATLSSFRCKDGDQSAKVQIQRVKEVYLSVKDGYIFPLKPIYEKLRRAVSSGDEQLPAGLPDPEVEDAEVTVPPEGNLERGSYRPRQAWTRVGFRRLFLRFRPQARVVEGRFQCLPCHLLPLPTIPSRSKVDT